MEKNHRVIVDFKGYLKIWMCVSNDFEGCLKNMGVFPMILKAT